MYTVKDHKSFPDPYKPRKRPQEALMKAPTHGPVSSSFLGLPYRILNINHKRNYLEADG